MSAVVLSLLSVLAAAPPAAAPAPAVVREVLPGGVHVVVLRDRSAPLVAARALWSGGTLGESPDEAGISAVMAGAWTAGCGRRDAAALADALADEGATMVGFAGRDTAGLAAEWTLGGWERGFELLADCAASPRFEADAVQRARGRALEREAERAGDPAWVALALVERQLGGARAAGPPVFAGGPTGLERIDAPAVREHRAGRYPVGAMTLAVVGDVEPERVLARARARFGDARRPAPTAPPGPVGPVTEPELYRRLDGAGAAIVAVAYPAVGRAHRDRAALEVLALLLGSGAALLTDADRGALVVHRACRPDRISLELAALRGAVERLRGQGPGEAEVRRAGARLAAGRRAAMARPDRAAALLALYEHLGPGAAFAARHADRLAAVRAADVAEAARRYLRPEVSVVATVSPLAASPEAKRRLRGVVRRATGRAKPVRARPERRRGRGRR